MAAKDQKQFSYSADGKQFIAVAAGMKSAIWETEPSSSRFFVLGLE
ncbi:MAG: hypothetical protein ACXVB4_07925 [Pseudobdellovibrionaceae bacterium]